VPLRGGQFPEPGVHGGGVDTRGGTVFPVDLEGFAALHGGVVVVGHHGHAFEHVFVEFPFGLEYVLHAGHGFGGRLVEVPHLAVVGRRPFDGSVEHARNLHVDAEPGRAVHFEGHVGALRRFAHQPEVFRVFELGFLGHCQLAGGCHQFAVAQALARGFVVNLAFAGVKVAFGGVPRWAAALVSISRAAAPALRSVSQEPFTLLLPPTPMSPYFLCATAGWMITWSRRTSSSSARMAGMEW
jgi:hypothetical protein